LQAKLLLCERIIYLLHQVAQARAWERGKGGMRYAFPPYGRLVAQVFNLCHPHRQDAGATENFSAQSFMGIGSPVDYEMFMTTLALDFEL
jgi:hypothetical protein